VYNVTRAYFIATQHTDESVCFSSVRLSQRVIPCLKESISSNFPAGLVSSLFECNRRYKIPVVGPNIFDGSVNCRGRKILRFSTDIAICL